MSAVATWTPAAPAQDTVAREVAVTFDDLPVVSVKRRDVPSWRDITSRLLAPIAAHKVPAIGFVNESKLVRADAVDPERVALLQAWLDAGLELGNHSFSHFDLHRTPLDVFQKDVIRGEEVTRALAARQRRPFRYFRHPFLHTGETLAKKRDFERFLQQRGYRVAPVTIDNDDYMFATAYDRAEAANDTGLMDRVAGAYVPYMEAKFAYYEQQSTALFGREIRQILLLHANSINARRFDALARMMTARGYRFVSLDRALTDAAYRSPDTYTGPAGIAWLHRWAMTKGVDRKTFFRGEPDVPRFVAEAAAR